MTFASPEPGHWTSRLGIISMQFNASQSVNAGAVCFFGDSLQEQRPTQDPRQGLPFQNLSGTGKYGAANASASFNCGLMGIGAADLYQAIQQIYGVVLPGRAVFSIGTNDAFARNHTDAFIAAWKTDAANCIGYLINMVGDAKYVLVETVPYALDGTHDNDLIDTFNAYLVSYGASRGCLILDVCQRLTPGRVQRRSGALTSDLVHLGGWGVSRREFDEQCMFTNSVLPPP